MISSIFYESDYKSTIVGFRYLNKLNRFIKVQKAQNQLSTRNNVVYKIFCKDCDGANQKATQHQNQKAY